MAKHVYNSAKTFRQAFTVPNAQALKWFPGHMLKGMERIQATLKDIDCVVEVHDARIPISGRNPNFRNILSLRPHLLLLNKADLVDLNSSQKETITTMLRSEGVDTVFFTDLRQFQQNKFLKTRILPKIIELTESRPRFSREGLNEFNILVIGVPNVGKSTLINTLRWANLGRKGKASSVGAIAGVTRSVMSKIKVKTEPPMYIVDTPGILTPKIPDIETGMRLALCSCLPDYLVEEENIVDYLLYWMNRRGLFRYVDYYQMDAPTDSHLELLAHVAFEKKKVNKVKDVATNEYKMMPNFKEAAMIVLKAFREGHLGGFLLDDDKI
ncbi:mitochondrial ribosome-associated GTPase 1-like [Gigantopelta aegis]|uniref:mitochondrial ribosome-associated GTPase 1-like n=1 Tax=Gigantopelta aegis TaxID=1735272 RepID=UPI001B888269|nr:mitochondrial ribosome-associated GTPase 1-like [Gigantopelta aegis]